MRLVVGALLEDTMTLLQLNGAQRELERKGNVHHIDCIVKDIGKMQMIMTEELQLHYKTVRSIRRQLPHSKRQICTVGNVNRLFLFPPISRVFGDLATFPLHFLRQSRIRICPN